MAFSYDSDLASTTDKLRFLVQDTVEADHLLEDAEIAFIASTEPNLYRAAAVLCRTIAANILKTPGFEDDIKWKPEEKAAEYGQLADDYDKKALQSAGVSISADAISANLLSADGDEMSAQVFTKELHLND